MNFITRSVALLALAVLFSGPALAAKTDITIGMALEPPNLDPTSGAAAAIDEVVYANIYEGLTRFGEDGSINPALASEWALGQEGKRYVFTLRTGVKFHDGADFTADDVKFSLDRARGERSTNAQKGLFSNITDVEVIDDATVAINLENPDGNLLFNLAWGDAIILDSEAAMSAATDPVGTGPFKFSNWVKGDRIEIERNADYWGEAVALEKATFKFIDDPTAAFAAMMAGDVDAFPNFPAPENLAQFDADPRFNVILGSTEGETILSMNNQNEYLSDIRVRKAISYAIDRQAIIDGAMFGYGTPIGSHFAPHHPSYVDLTENSVFDQDASRALLREVGLENDLTLRLVLPPPAYARRGGEIVAAQLREVGIETVIENVEWAQWLEQVFKGKDFDLSIVSHTEPMDFEIYARDDYYFQYESPVYNEIMDAYNVETKAEQRDVMLKQAQTVISEDYVNGFLFQLAKTGVASSKIKGLWPNQPTQANDLTGVSWDE